MNSITIWLSIFVSMAISPHLMGQGEAYVFGKDESAPKILRNYSEVGQFVDVYLIHEQLPSTANPAVNQLTRPITLGRDTITREGGGWYRFHEGRKSLAFHPDLFNTHPTVTHLSPSMLIWLGIGETTHQLHPLYHVVSADGVRNRYVFRFEGTSASGDNVIGTCHFDPDLGWVEFNLNPHCERLLFSAQNGWGDVIIYQPFRP